ncbi:hypothetical protein FAZ69_18290 [Trinickia terrae]|uniref:UDP-N-acetylglucosamine 2-epimerase domain-containing protein n=1 Tax=Trinickia terrae TaxID=2571161 RepID=A0A4U1I268_9BURK|nr:UDP-N-acetylglucosamine 2-epimerase [Trinickia terrae]TKC87283.1 hypothetical protein FAZ69_18290 [Trinickia terrae]
MHRMNHAIERLDSARVASAVEAANERGRPLYLIVLATKPCYIKLASLVHACVAHGVPFLLIDSGQHYDADLTGARRELGYEHLVAAAFGIRGSLIERAAQLAHGVAELSACLQASGLRMSAIPVISGDTSTAALFPQYWYFAHGIRSVHVEAGLRSLAPPGPEHWRALDDNIRAQRACQWLPVPDEPFPEGVDTRLASVVSGLLLAPVARNAEQLVREGYPAGCIERVGSLSSDAVKLAQAAPAGVSIFERHPQLADGRWLRVDLHRRENMTPQRVAAVLEGIARLSRDGFQVVLIKTNALMGALRQHGLTGLLADVQKRGVVVHELWPSYADVIAFLASPHCRAIYTDSGGLQEEAAVLGVPCMTCRFSTDRPETVLDVQANLLVPPLSATFVHRHVAALLSGDADAAWPGLADGARLYGHEVGAEIARRLAGYEPPDPLAGAQARYAKEAG